MSANSELSIEAHSSSSEKPSSSSTSAKTVFEQVDSSQSTHRDLDVETVNEPEDSSSTSIPPADGGKGAWMFLAGCFIFEALVWGKSISLKHHLSQKTQLLTMPGFPFSFGVFQSYYTTHPPFSLHTAGIAAIGTCSSGVMYLFAPVTLYALESFPSIRRLSSIIGLAIAVMALIASSFATKVWLLILTQGVLYAIGGSLLYSPTMFYLDEWFVRKKGLAFGIMWAGVGTVCFPYILSPLPSPLPPLIFLSPV